MTVPSSYLPFVHAQSSSSGDPRLAQTVLKHLPVMPAQSETSDKHPLVSNFNSILQNRPVLAVQMFMLHAQSSELALVPSMTEHGACQHLFSDLSQKRPVSAVHCVSPH
jgi:hypothetical protein